MVQRGTTALVVLLTFYLLLQLGRAVFHGEGSPALVVAKPGSIWVLLGEGFSTPGIHQFSDGTTLQGVIKMADPSAAGRRILGDRPDRSLINGEAVDIISNSRQGAEIKCFWMPAEQRMALGIPLHPDRMQGDDWEALPGIGAKLAKRIEQDRQKNGEFGSLEGLKRVRGVGEGRLEAWKEFFAH